MTSGQPARAAVNRSAAIVSDVSSVTTHAPAGMSALSA